MRRDLVSVLGAIIVGSTLSVAVAGLQRRGGEAPKVAKIEKIKDNLYYIFEPASGGNTAALVTDNGVILVDAKYAGWGQEILHQLHTGRTSASFTTSCTAPGTTCRCSSRFETKCTVFQTLIVLTVHKGVLKAEYWSSVGGRRCTAGPARTRRDAVSGWQRPHSSRHPAAG